MISETFITQKNRFVPSNLFNEIKDYSIIILYFMNYITKKRIKSKSNLPQLSHQLFLLLP